MKREVFEEMLFGFASSQHSSIDPGPDVDKLHDSEDEMLNDGYDFDVDIWDSTFEPELTKPPTDPSPDSDRMDVVRDADVGADGVRTLEGPPYQPRNR